MTITHSISENWFDKSELVLLPSSSTRMASFAARLDEALAQPGTMDLEFLRHFFFWRRVSREPGPALLLGAGTAFCFVVMVGGDVYLDRIPTLREVAGYLASSLVMSPVGASLIAVKGGWGQQRIARQFVIGIVVVVVVGLLATWLLEGAIG